MCGEVGVSLWQDVLYDALNVTYTPIGRIRLESVNLNSKCHFVFLLYREKERESG